ncbi:MAG: PTS-dependent dihydroxyacetone kinase phosphotransferase subunit DhaM [Clostridiales bacterium]|nr:PTS-dependent dihydroxyacetone kinase phosphotransferase subunit DhaM [Clostridiales bacterium]
MTGLLLVSHSRKLAEGVRELAAQMGGQVPMAVAAGDEEGGLGTDGSRVKEALEALLQEADEVVVLMDLGSAYLSAETALELLDPEKQRRVLLADAPFVEGAVMAAVVAGTGEGGRQVKAAAEEARKLLKIPKD